MKSKLDKDIDRLHKKAFKAVYKPQPEWDEVLDSKIFTFRIDHSGYEMAETTDVYLSELVRKYIGIEMSPVRIKCKKGAILIERLKGVGK